MKGKHFILVLGVLFLNLTASAQRRGNIWCFGDSALVDFNDTANILTNRSILKSRGSCASICDSSGNLLLYTAYDLRVFIGNSRPTKIMNGNHQVLQNGDSLKGGGWYRELAIVPFPGSDSLFCVFHIGVTDNYGLYYSIADIRQNGGLGAVIQKNVQLLNFEMVDCLTAIKHGNGRDWWVIARKWDSWTFTPNNEFHCFLVTPDGISSDMIQNVGSDFTTGFGAISFNKEGDKMSYLNTEGLLELFDFDRCTGLISNPDTILPDLSIGPYPFFWSSEFSPDGNLLYVQSIAAQSVDSSRLYQFDLNAPDIAASADTLWSTPFMINMGQLKLAPDNKIYMSTNYYGGYPYADSVYNYVNMNLSVINSPDSLGTACNLQPFSFSLGGARSYFGLPNNPDYDLPALSGSPCDTLLSLTEPTSISSPELFIYYAPNWQTAFINAQKLNGHTYNLSVYDLLGNEAFKEAGKLNPPYFTKNLNCTAFAKGMYVVVLQTDREQLTKKFVVE